jgi:hypothetical protein
MLLMVAIRLRCASLMSLCGAFDSMTTSVFCFGLKPSRISIGLSGTDSLGAIRMLLSQTRRLGELLKTSKSVRGELVEPHLHQQTKPLTKLPFDKLRACPVMLKAGGERWVFIGTAHNMVNSAALFPLTRPVGHPLPRAGEGLGVRASQRRH